MAILPSRSNMRSFFGARKFADMEHPEHHRVVKTPGAAPTVTGYCGKCDKHLDKDYYSEDDVYKALKRHDNRLHKTADMEQQGMDPTDDENDSEDDDSAGGLGSAMSFIHTASDWTSDCKQCGGMLHLDDDDMKTGWQHIHENEDQDYHPGELETKHVNHKAIPDRERKFPYTSNINEDFEKESYKNPPIAQYDEDGNLINEDDQEKNQGRAVTSMLKFLADDKSRGGDLIAPHDSPTGAYNPTATHFQTLHPDIQKKTLDHFAKNGGPDHETMVNNIMATHRHAQMHNKDALKDGMTWYNKAHEYAKGLAEKHGTTVRHASGIIAAESPRSDWDHENKPVADYIMSKVGPNATKRGETLNISDATKHKALGAATEAYSKAKDEHAAKLAKHVADPKKNKHPGDAPEPPKPLVPGKKYSEMGTQEAVNGAYNQSKEEDYRTTSPDAPGGRTQKGEARKVAFSSGSDNHRKAVRIARGEEPDDVLGGHKVRSFHNNIMDPNNEHKHDDVTIDTHAMALAANSMDKTKNIKLLSGGAHKATNINGAHAHVADAYREAHKRLVATGEMHKDSAPLHLQAQTWGHWRGLAEGSKSFKGIEHSGGHPTGWTPGMHKGDSPMHKNASLNVIASNPDHRIDPNGGPDEDPDLFPKHTGKDYDYGYELESGETDSNTKTSMVRWFNKIAYDDPGEGHPSGKEVDEDRWNSEPKLLKNEPEEDDSHKGKPLKNQAMVRWSRLDFKQAAPQRLITKDEDRGDSRPVSEKDGNGYWPPHVDPNIKKSSMVRWAITNVGEDPNQDQQAQKDNMQSKDVVADYERKADEAQAKYYFNYDKNNKERRSFEHRNDIPTFMSPTLVGHSMKRWSTSNESRDWNMPDKLRDDESIKHDEPEPALPEVEADETKKIAVAPRLDPNAQDPISAQTPSHNTDPQDNNHEQMGYEDSDRNILSDSPMNLPTFDPYADLGTQGSRNWLMQDKSDNLDIAAMAKRVLETGIIPKESAKKFSPKEQHELISEDGGKPRNFDRMDVTGSHYELLDEDEYLDV